MTGRRNDRHFRIIVAEHTAGPKSGKYVEKLGFINPRTKEKKIDVERAKYWLSVGAQPTVRVYNMLVDEGVIDGPKKNALPKKTPIKKESDESGDQNTNSSSQEQASDENNTEKTDSENSSDSMKNTEQESEGGEDEKSE